MHLLSSCGGVWAVVAFCLLGRSYGFRLDCCRRTGLPSRLPSPDTTPGAVWLPLDSGTARPRVVLDAALDSPAGRPRAARRPGRRVVARREVEGMPHPARSITPHLVAIPGLPETCPPGEGVSRSSPSSLVQSVGIPERASLAALPRRPHEAFKFVERQRPYRASPSAGRSRPSPEVPDRRTTTY